MIEDHAHDELGHVVISEPSPAETELEATEVVADSAVEIARIEADKEITLARIAAKMVDPDLEAQLAAAQAELETLRAIVSPAPAPEPVEAAPVVIVAEDGSQDDAEPVESLPVPDAVDQVPEQPRHKPAGLGMW